MSDTSLSPRSPWTVVFLPGGDKTLDYLGDLLTELGAEGFSTERGVLQAFFPRGTWSDVAFERVRFALDRLTDAGVLPQGTLRFEEVPDFDWVGQWRRGLGPIRAGEHILVVPPGITTEPCEGDIVLNLEPRMAFGTGEHPTTRMALALLEQAVKPGQRVLDLGCGNGVLSIAALLLGADRCVGVDNEEESVLETRENAEVHCVSDRLEVVKADVLKLPEVGTFDLLLANIFIRPILAGLPDWLQRLNPGGEAIFTGVREGRETDRLRETARRAGLEPLDEKRLDIWFSARYRYQPA